MCEDTLEITVWLDLTEKPDSTAHFELCKIDQYLVTFRDCNRCIDFITDQCYTEVKICLIMSADLTFTVASLLLSLCEELDQIDSIFILSSFTFNHSGLTKIHGIYSNLESLSAVLSKKCTIRPRHRNDKSEFRRFSSGSVTSDDDNSRSETVPLYGTNVDFICSKFLVEILNQINTTRQEMVDFCLEKCGHNQCDFDAIKEFEEYYTAEYAIAWYTRDTFLYRLLNAALRTLDIEKLYSLRFFIRDLDAQLVKRFESQRLDPAALVLYRGQFMSAVELENKILNNIGGFYPVPNFLSTTGNRDLAEIFAGEGTNIEADSVLFEIEVPKSSQRVAYADITKDSAFGDSENEVLFTMGAVFRIISAEQMYERAWLVKLKLSDDDYDEDEETRQVQLRFKNEIISSNGTMNLAKLASRMARYGVAVKFYDLLLQNPPVNDELIPLSKIHDELGFVYYNLQQYENAIEHYEASIQIDLKEYPRTDLRFFKRYNDLGCAYLANRDFMKAEEILNIAMNIIEDISEPDQTSIEIYVKIIADFFRAKNRDPFIESLNEREDSPVHKFESFLEKYPNSLSLGNDIGTVYYVKKNYEKAMEMYELCLANQLSVDRYDPRVAQTYSNIAFVYFNTARFDMAIDYFNKELKILKKNYHSNHLDIAGANKVMAICYYLQGDLEQALAYLTKLLDSQIYNFSQSHSSVDETMTWIIRISEGLALEGPEEEST